jgi:hypothetical protein
MCYIITYDLEVGRDDQLWGKVVMMVSTIIVSTRVLRFKVRHCAAELNI